MHSRNFWAAFLAFSLSSFTAQSAPARPQEPGCNTQSVMTVTRMVTVTAPAVPQASPTTKAGNNVNIGTNNPVKVQNGNGGKNNTTGGIKNGGSNTKTNTTTNTSGGGGDSQTSLTLDPKVVAAGFANDGQDVPTAGQVPSLTSKDNFINFCLSVKLPLTNGQQIKTGSCNPAPMGVIPSTANMPSSKFVNPANFGTIKANTAFTIVMAIQGMEAGFFVNANSNYFAAPQFLNAQGQVQGHSHVVIEKMTSIGQTTATDPSKFEFFKGLNNAAKNGQLSADVTAGLPVGVYRLSSINTAANHQPVLVPIAQHGSLDDMIYFTVTADGQPDGSANGGANATATATATSIGSTATSANGTESTTTTSAAGNATETATNGKGGKGGKGDTSTTDTALPTTTATGAASPANPGATTPVAGGTAPPPTTTAAGKNTKPDPNAKGTPNAKTDTTTTNDATSTSVTGTATPSPNPKSVPKGP